MNKKAFTLVELLAVIVILAIILTIAIPTISHLTTTSAKNAFESSVKLLIKSVELKLLENSSFDITTIKQNTVESLLKADASNYSVVNVRYDLNGKVYATVLGAGKWTDLYATGTYSNLSIDSSNSIVSDGILLHLNAGNVSSYSGSGVTWNDLGTYGNNGTLTNGTLFNPANGGYMTFDGVNDYVAFNAGFNGTPNTLMAWVKVPTTVPSGNRVGNIVGNYPNTNGVNFEIHAYGKPRFYWNTGQIDWMPNFDTRTDNWILLCFVRDTNITFYQNGQYHSTKTGTTSTIVPAGFIRVGDDARNGTNPGIPFNGSIGQIIVYNRALTDLEVMQIYNATKNRFGL